jgi:DNA segregation ATPase FtsK/SpoIIIE-like protein
MPDDIDDYNRRSGSSLPRIALLIDEANTYLGNKAIEPALADLSRRGRKWGVHLILAAHNWRAADVPREVSGMYKTRICLRVEDNTSGTVVLGTKRWGDWCERIKLPGRAVIATNGRSEPVQLYNVSKEQEAEWLKETEAPSPLSQEESIMVRKAIEELEGKFIIDRLAEKLEGQGISRWKIQQTGKSFEQRGWLTKPADAASPRMVKPELARLAGIKS